MSQPSATQPGQSFAKTPAETRSATPPMTVAAAQVAALSLVARGHLMARVLAVRQFASTPSPLLQCLAARLLAARTTTGLPRAPAPQEAAQTADKPPPDLAIKRNIWICAWHDGRFCFLHARTIFMCRWLPTMGVLGSEGGRGELARRLVEAGRFWLALGVARERPVVAGARPGSESYRQTAHPVVALPRGFGKEGSRKETWVLLCTLHSVCQHHPAHRIPAEPVVQKRPREPRGGEGAGADGSEGAPPAKRAAIVQHEPDRISVASLLT